MHACAREHKEPVQKSNTMRMYFARSTWPHSRARNWSAPARGTPQSVSLLSLSACLSDISCLSVSHQEARRNPWVLLLPIITTCLSVSVCLSILLSFFPSFLLFVCLSPGNRHATIWILHLLTLLECMHVSVYLSIYLSVCLWYVCLHKTLSYTWRASVAHADMHTWMSVQMFACVCALCFFA